jgi:uncharacterized protein
MSSLTSKPFTLQAEPGTDIWRKPPTTDRFNGQTTLGESGPLSQFRRACVTVSGSWKHQYDQGGLLLITVDPQGKRKWIKAGVEFYNGSPWLSTVGCDTWADWSIYPLESDRVMVEVVRDHDQNGTGLWVYRLVLDETGKVKERIPVREVTWFFAEQDGWKVEAKAYAARPAKGEEVGNEFLEVEIHNFEFHLS